MSNFHYQDGLLRTLRHCGRCIVDMIPHYYNTRRTVRILGEDDSAEHVVINDPQQEQQEQNGQMVTVDKVLHNLTAGKYDVTVSSGPSFSTMRQESAEFFSNAMSAAKDPATASVISYLAIKNQDVPNSELAAKLIKATLQQIIDDETGSDKKDGEQEPTAMLPEGPLPLSQVPQAIDALKQQVVQATEAAKGADVDKQKAAVLDAQNKQQELSIKANEVKIKAYEAETKRMEAVAKDENEKTQLRIEGVEAQAAKLEALDCAIQSAKDEALKPEDVHQIVTQSRPPPPSGMTIKAPSGASYEIALH